jgi:iron complex outermembrane receptor protein
MRTPFNLSALAILVSLSPISLATENTQQPSKNSVLEPEEVEVFGYRDSVQGYSAVSATGGTKSDTPLIETPMSVQVIPKAVIDGQQATSLKDVVRNSSGVTPNSYSYYDFIQIRGFTNGYAANYRNGLQLQAMTGLEMAAMDLSKRRAMPPVK